ncbi:hypothetical protein ACW2Q0_27095 [Nocardia sp. R16R-3T]
MFNYRGFVRFVRGGNGRGQCGDLLSERNPSGRGMVVGTAALKDHLGSLRWQIARLIAAVVLALAAFMVFLFTSNPASERDAPAVPLPAITSPLLPTTSSEPTQPAPRD